MPGARHENGRRRVLGVIGPGDDATPRDVADAFEVAALAARAGWVVLTGGRAVGVMDAASRGARSAEGLAIGVLPDTHDGAASRALDLAIITGLGEMRDQVVVLSSDAIVVCGISAGTAAEASIAIKAHKPVVLIRPDAEVTAFFRRLGADYVRATATPEEGMKLARELVEAASEVRGPRS